MGFRTKIVGEISPPKNGGTWVGTIGARKGENLASLLGCPNNSGSMVSKQVTSPTLKRNKHWGEKKHKIRSPLDPVLKFQVGPSQPGKTSAHLGCPRRLRLHRPLA